MSSYYTYEEKLGRKRLNRELIETSPNVVDFEPFIIAAEGLRSNKRAQRVYDFYLRKGYVFVKGKHDAQL